MTKLTGSPYVCFSEFYSVYKTKFNGVNDVFRMLVNTKQIGVNDVFRLECD